jgi:Putative auto-transporter adhesin, head GIN domain
MRKSLAAAAIAACAATASCSKVHAEDGGPSVSRNYSVGPFQQIEVAGPYDVAVRTGANVAVAGSGPQKLIERTVVEVKGDKLIIRPEQHNHWFGSGWSTRGHASFTVTVPQLLGATTAGSGDIKIDRVAGDRFNGTVAGSGGIDVAAMDVQQLKLTVAGSGGVKAGQGKAQSADYDIVGSGDVDARAVQTQQVKVSIAGSGGVRAHSSGTADVSIVGSGDVDLTGGAKCKVSKMGSGDVRCS